MFPRDRAPTHLYDIHVCGGPVLIRSKGGTQWTGGLSNCCTAWTRSQLRRLRWKMIGNRQDAIGLSGKRAERVNSETSGPY